MTTSELTRARAHLEVANRIRIRRAALKRSIKAGDADLVELLREPLPGWLSNEPIGRLLGALPLVGLGKTRTLLLAVGSPRLNVSVAVGKLTDRERLALADALDEFLQEREYGRAERRRKKERREAA